MMTNSAAPRARTAIVSVILCSITTLPTIADAADRGLGADAAAACAALSGAGTGAARIDAAALTEPKPLTVAESGPDPAAPSVPRLRNSAACWVASTRPIPTRRQSASAQSAAAVERPLVQYGGGGFKRRADHRRRLATGSALQRRLAAGEGICDLRHRLRPRTRPGQPPQLFAANDEAFLNFAHVSYKKVRDAAVMLIDRLTAPGREAVFRRQFGGRARGLTMAHGTLPISMASSPAFP